MTMTDEVDLTEERDLTEEDQEEVKLAGRRCRVLLSDGTRLELRITNREYIGWDKTAPRKKWGAMADVPFLAATFMAWLAAKRQDETTLTWEQWQTQVVECENLAEEPEDLARPTQKAAQPEHS